jgi:3-methylcrotonyl-CoA carboxylase alpha subunit
LNLDGARYRATVEAYAGSEYVFWGGRTYVLHLEDPLTPAAVEDGSARGLRAPMPGRILALLAAPGAIVRQGAPLLVLEAMKIEHTILAPAAGVLQAFRVAAGEQVAEGAELVSFDPTPESKE